MSKPLHKNPSFWIVAVTLVVAADVAQFYFGVPWLTQKLAGDKQAPRIALGPASGVFFSQRQNPSHAPGEWRLPYPEPNIFQEASNVVAILPSKFALPTGGWSADNPPQGGWATMRQDKTIGIRFPAEVVIEQAYSWRSRARILFQDRPPSGQFDFIANLPSGGLEALQREIQKQWGLTADRETFQTNAMVLIVSQPNVLKPGTPGSRSSQPNSINFGTIQNMVSILETTLNTPIVNQTDLTGMYDLQFPMTALNGPRTGAQRDQRVATVKKLLEDQFGLDLIETNTAVEMLVVKKMSVAEAQQQGATR